MQAISFIYWRRIKAGTRTFASITDLTVATEVKTLAQQDVAASVITATEYLDLIGKAYTAPDDNT